MGTHAWDWGTPCLGLGYPQNGPGTSQWGTSQPPGKDMGPVEVLWDGERVPPWVWTDIHL